MSELGVNGGRFRSLIRSNSLSDRPSISGGAVSPPRPPLARTSQGWSELITRVDGLIKDDRRISKSGHGAYFRLDPRHGGFLIQVSQESNRTFLVSFGSWFDEFETAISVFNIIKDALAGRIRTKSEYVGGKLSGCAVELITKEKDWVEFAKVSYPRLSLFRRERETTYAHFHN